MSYLLLVDDEEELLSLHEIMITSAFNVEIVLATSGNDALKKIEERGIPFAVVSDLRMPDGDGEYLFNQLKSRGINVPFLVCSGDPIYNVQEKIQGAYGYIEKPNTAAPLIEKLRPILPALPPVEYVAIKLSTLLHSDKCEFNVFIKLSDSKYVKVFNQGCELGDEDLNKFRIKNISHLHITREDAVKFVKKTENKLNAVLNGKLSVQNEADYTIATLKSAQKMAVTLNWSNESVELAKKSINMAIKVVSSNKEIMTALEKKLNYPDSCFCSHASSLTLVTCHFSQLLGWASVATQTKLAVAALIHDATLEEKQLENYEYWNMRAKDSNDTDPLVCSYRNHPIDAVDLLKKIKLLPSDVDQIVVQHHENSNGTGFPHKQTGNRINPLSALFIISEDFVHFLNRHENIKERESLFFKTKETEYSCGTLKKVFLAIKKQLKS